MTPGVKALLEIIRQHHAFREFCSAVEKPVIRPFRVKDAGQIENSRAQWIYESGKLAQHEAWLAMLTGKTEVE